VKAVAAVPGVELAGGSMNAPLAGTLNGDFVVSRPGTPPPSGAERVRQSDWITPGMFAAFGILVDAGRDFDEHDTPASPKVMIVNEAFARRFSPDASPLGRPLTLTFRAQGDYSLGALTVVYAIALGFWYRELTWKDLFEATSETVVFCGVLVFIIAAAVPFGWLISFTRLPAELATTVLQFTKDPAIVLDELVGQSIALLGAPHWWPAYVTSVALFRLFDIWKPFGAREAQELPGGIGVVVDDMIAGLAACLALQLSLWGARWLGVWI